MKKLPCLFILILLKLSIHAQNFSWAKKMGGSNSDHATCIVLDQKGNSYITGGYEGTVDFDPNAGIFNHTSQGGADIFITKLDPSGKLIWAKSIGGEWYNQANSIAVDDNGYIYLTGLYSKTMDFDPSGGTFNLTSNGSLDVFISKLDSSGNFIWAVSFGSTEYDDVNTIKLDKNGNVYISGFFNETVDFDPSNDTFNIKSAGIKDIYILKLDTLGDFVWVKRIGGTSEEFTCSLTLDSNANIYIAGNFGAIVDFDPGPGIFNLTSDVGNIGNFILKLDASGNFIWAKSYAGKSAFASTFALDVKGNIYVSGAFFDSSDFNPGLEKYNLTSTGASDVFILKLDNQGNFEWAKSLGGAENDGANSIMVDKLGNAYIVGEFSGNSDFDPGPGVFNLISRGARDIFITKLDFYGNFMWAVNFGGTGHDISRSLAIEGLENILITGSFQESADFDPGIGTSNLVSLGSNDIFIVKLRNNIVGIKETMKLNPFTIFPNPTECNVTVQTDPSYIGENYIITDPLGRTIISGKLNSITCIDLNNLSNGLYYFITENNKKLTYKVIKH